MTIFFDFAILGSSLSMPGFASSYAANLQRALEQGSNRTIRCYNFAVSGGKTTEALTHVGKVIALRPRAVLIETQINDCAALTTGQSTTNINSIIDQLQAGTPATAIILMTMNKVLGSQASGARASLNTFYDIYRTVAPAQGVDLLDLYGLWANATIIDIPDELHPTNAAVTKIALPHIRAKLASLF